MINFQGIGAQGNYAQAGKAVADDTLRAFIAARRNSPNYGEMAITAADIRKTEKLATLKNQAEVAATRLTADADVKAKKMQIDSASKLKTAKRKAGALAVAGQMATEAGALFGEEKRKKRDLSVDDPYYNSQTALIKKQMDDIEARMKEGYGKKSEPSASTSLPSSTSNTDLSYLTPDDYKHLAYAISSEAGPGKDRYAVAASILNRVKSDKFPNNVKDVIYADGQYEGVYKGLSKDRPDIAKDLSSATGQAEILSSLKLLDGRTDFKGQTQLHNRSNKGNKDGMMDPMVDPKGNFFHYHWQ